MPYQTRGYSALFNIAIELDLRRMIRAVEERAEIEYVETAPGSATIIGKLVSEEDGSYRFEGIADEEDRTFPAGTPISEVLSHWPAFTNAQRERNEADRKARRG